MNRISSYAESATMSSHTDMIFARESTGRRSPAISTFLIILQLQVFGQLASADDSVHVLRVSPYNKQLLTSSILTWLPQPQVEVQGDHDFVIGGFKFVPKEEDDATSRIDSKPIFVCRAALNGVYVSGGQVAGEKKCVVSLLGIVHPYDRYDLLVNVEKAARLTWVHWDKYVRPPDGSISTTETFVARHKVMDEETDLKTVGFTHYIGKYDPNDKLGSITYVKDGVEVSVDSGEVLVEWEPISYELKSVKFNHWKKRVIKRFATMLGRATLANDGNVPAKVAKAFAYSYNHSVYWGQGHAILKGLPTTIYLNNGTKLPLIEWGIEIHELADTVDSVDIYLEPGTAVNVTLMANYTDMEVPYTAELISHYADGTKMSRPISGVHREEGMMDVVPKFERIYYTGNFSLVPTTTTTTTTTTAAPTTVTQRTSRPNKIGGFNDRDENDPDSVHTNVIDSDKKENDGNGRQEGDGGPLSLKNKVDEGGKSKAADLLTCPKTLIFIIVGIFVPLLRDFST